MADSVDELKKTDLEIMVVLAKEIPDRSYDERKKLIAAAHQPEVDGGRLISFMTPSQIRSYEPPEGSVLVGENHIVKPEIFVIGGAPGVGQRRGTVHLT